MTGASALELVCAHAVAAELLEQTTARAFAPATTGLGTRTASCTYTDNGGATATASATYAVGDTTGPELSTPSDASAEAASSAGAAVTYATPLATDLFDGPRHVTCTPSSGTVFPLGTTTVTCSASDNAGNEGSTTFPVSVADTTGPQLPLLGQVTAEARSASGATVTYAAADAVDLVDGPRPTICAPVSGSTFALGTTTVTCTASDTRGNSSSATFPVVVQDESAPVVEVPPPLVAEATSPAGAVVGYGEVTAADAVDGTIPASCTPAASRSTASRRLDR